MDFRTVLNKDRHTLVDNGTKAQSEVIYIPPGKTALLSLYNMSRKFHFDGDKVVSNQCISIRKLSFSAVKALDVDFDCKYDVDLTLEVNKLLAQRRVFSEPVFQDCEEWGINPCSNFALIPVPGFYVLEMSDMSQLDDVHIEYATLNVSDTIGIPDSFKIGSSK